MNPEPMQLAEIRAKEPEIVWHHFRDCRVEGIENDSRKMQPGKMFVALSGTRHEGSQYLEEALAKGAVAVLAEEYRPLSKTIPFGVISDPRKALSRISHAFWREPAKGMKIIGITGTIGKTTTSFLLQSILEKAGLKTGLLGTTGYRYAGQFYPPTHTTPDPLELNEHFARMRDAGITHVVMEVSSHSLDQGRVAHLSFEAGIFTNLSRDHLDYHKTMENYLDAKSILFRGLGKDKVAVFNEDDPASESLRKVCKSRLFGFRFSPGKNAFVYAENVQEPGIQNRFTLVSKEGKAEIALWLPGAYNIYNALAAATCALALSIPLPSVGEGLNSLLGVPGRMERIASKAPFEVFVDFAHTDEALRKALLTIKQIHPKRLLLVFGCGGDRDRGKRPMMGKAASQLADFTWITNDNPRSEEPSSIAKAISEGFTNPNQYKICLDRTTAIEEAISHAQAGDIVLIAGKGHENVQIIGNQTFPFSDQDVVTKCLAKY